MPPLKAILLDLDNTLFHWDPCDLRGRESAHAALRQHIDVTFDQFMRLHKEAREHLKHSLHGQGSNHNRILFFKYIADHLTDRPRPSLALTMYQRYWQAFFATMKPHPDAHRVLSQLKTTYKLAMVSNHVTQPQLDKVVRLGFEPYFDAIFTSEEMGYEKPDPRIFQAAAARLGAQPAETVMIGDHVKGDIEGAHAAGLRTIYVAEFTGGEPAPPCATCVAHRLADVLERVRGM
jgi:putative hydrolase of the HAD superfamily